MDDESKLTLHGLVQHYMMLHEEEKNRKLNDLLDALDFNQVRSMHLSLAFLSALVSPMLLVSILLPSCLSVGVSLVAPTVSHWFGWTGLVGASCGGTPVVAQHSRSAQASQHHWLEDRACIERQHTELKVMQPRPNAC